MAAPTIRHIEAFEDIRASFQVMKELRPHLEDDADFVARVSRMRAQNYRLLGVLQATEVVALAGYRLQENLIYGPFLYVDDLVVTHSRRGDRHGARLLRELDRIAREAGCRRLVLDTGLGNALAQRFYFREGLLTGAMRFQKMLDE